MVDPGSKVMGGIWMVAGVLLILVRRRLATSWLMDFDAPDEGHRRMRVIIVAAGTFLLAIGAALQWSG